MPNGHGQREKHEKELIKAVEEDGWRVYPDPPNWVLSKAKSDGIDKRAGFTPKKNMYHGDNYIHLAVSSVHGLGIHVFSRRNPSITKRPHRKELARIVNSMYADMMTTSI